MLQPRSLVILEKNSKAQIIESHYSLNVNEKIHSDKHSTYVDPLTNTVTEIHVNENAKLDYYKIQNDLETTSIIDSTYMIKKVIVKQVVIRFLLGEILFVTI